MNKTQRIYFLLLEIILAFLTINIVKSFELKKDIIKRKKIEIKLRSLDSYEDDDKTEVVDEDDYKSKR